MRSPTGSTRSASRVIVGAGVLETLRAQAPTLSPRMRTVADHILSDPRAIVASSAARIAVETGTSVGTVIRLCQAIGVPGIHELRMRLAAESDDLTRADFDAEELSPSARTFLRIAETLARTARIVDHDVVLRSAELLQAAHRILVVSSGTSQPLAIEIGNSLNWAGYSVAYPSDSRTQEAVAERLGAQDVCFAISHSGTTNATLTPLRLAGERGAATIALTSYVGSPLALAAEHAVIAGATGDEGRSDEMASRMVHHAVLQVIRSLLPSPHPASTTPRST